MKKYINLITEAVVFSVSRAIVSFLWLCFFVFLEIICLFGEISWYYQVINFLIIAFFFYSYLKSIKLYHSIRK